MKLNVLGKCIIALTVLSALTLTGCGKKEKEITQGITPNALNFYILHQEIGAIRDKVKSSEAAKMPQYLPSYNELLGRSRKMLEENSASKELKKYPDINAAMDTCLKAGIEFMTQEARAIETNGKLANIRQELADIRQSVRNNSLLAKKQKPKIDALAGQESQAQKQLEGYKPALGKMSRSCMGVLGAYNKLILESKILEYANDEKLFSLFAWEKTVAPKPVKKPVKKKRR